MSEISKMLQEYRIPKVTKVRQTFNQDVLEDLEGVLRGGLEETCAPISPGARIAITCGSRGIDQYAAIIKTVVRYVKDKGGNPFLVPAMGSHGGATAAGQEEVLRRYGITEESVGAPVVSSMEVVQIGTTNKGLPVYIDKNAYEADGIILVNRVKPHTSFRGKYESGLVKMLAIGLAKQKGAEMTHFLRFENMAENIVAVGTIGLETLNILCGVCTIENGYNHVAELHVLRRDEILDKEPGYLQAAWKRMPRIALDTIDVLVVSEIGKEISGDGMDPNVVGRAYDYRVKPFIERIGVLDLSPKTGANFTGIGNADATTRKVLDKGSFEETYPNAITSITTEYARIPCVLDTDKLCFQFCLRTCPNLGEPLKVLWTKDTLHMGEFYVSESLLPEIEANPDVTTDGKLYMPVFDEEENFKGFEEV